MSEVIDEKIVSMEFQNGKFEKDIETTIKSLNKLNDAANLKPDTKGYNELDKQFSKLTSAVDKCANNITEKFSASSIAAITAVSRFTNTAITKVENFIKALTIDPVKTGITEYEQKLNSVQTILANTRKEGTKLSDVSGALKTLNEYADKTIYNFQQMTYNIGTFTAAGIKLQDSVDSIQGIANLAAVSGSNAEQASRAMYQMSQALSAGVMRLQDWKSMVNAGIGGQVFKDALLNTADALGVQQDIVKQIQSGQMTFEASLEKKWLTSDVITKTLAQFTMAAEKGTKEWEEYAKTLKSWGFKDSQIEDILNMANTAEDAATKVKTFTQLIDTMKEAVQSGWAESWEIIIGDFNEAKILWTKVSDWFGDVEKKISTSRNNLLQGWKDMGGRMILLNGIAEGIHNISLLLKPIKKAIAEVIPPMTSKRLVELTLNFRMFMRSLKTAEDGLLHTTLYNTAKALAMVFDLVRSSISELIKGLFSLASDGEEVGGGALKIINSIALAVQNLVTNIKKSKIINNTISATISLLRALIKFTGKVVNTFADWVAESKPLSTIASSIYDIWNAFVNMIQAVTSNNKAIDDTKDKFKGLKDVLDKANPVLERLASIIKKASVNIVNFLNSIAVDPNKVFDKLINKVNNFSTSIREGFKGLVNDVPGHVNKLIESIKSKIEAFFDKSDKDGLLAGLDEGTSDLSKGIFDVISNFGSNLKSGIDKFIDIVTGENTKANKAAHTLVDGIAGTLKYVLDSIERMINLIHDTIKKADWAGILLTGFKVYAIYNIVEAIGTISTAISKVLSSLNGLLVELKLLAKSVGNLAKAKLIESIVIAIVGLTASIAAMALLIKFNPEETKMAIISVIGMLAIISVAMVKLSKSADTGDILKASGFLLAFSIAVATLAAAIGIFSYALNKTKLENLIASIAILAIVIGGLIGLSILANNPKLDSLAKNPLKPGSIIGNLVAIAGGLFVFAVAVEQLASINWGNNWQEVASKIGVIIGTLVTVAILAFAGSKMTKSAGLNILAMAASFYILYLALKSIAEMSGELVKAIDENRASLAIVAGSLIAISYIVTKVSNSIIREVKNFGMVLIAMAASVYILTKAAQDLANVNKDALIKSFIVVAAMSAIIVGLAFAIKGAGGSESKTLGKNILYMAGAVAGLAVLVEVLAYLPENDLLKGIAVVGSMGLLIALIAAQAKKMEKNTAPILAFLGGLTAVFYLLIDMLKISAKMNTEKLLIATSGLSLILYTFSKIIKESQKIKNTKGMIKTMGSFVLIMASIVAMITIAAHLNAKSLSKGIATVGAALIAFYVLVKLAKAAKGIGSAEKTYDVAMKTLTKMTILLAAMTGMFVLLANYTTDLQNGIIGLAAVEIGLFGLMKLTPMVKDIGTAEKTYDKAMKSLAKMELLLAGVSAMFILLSRETNNLLNGIIGLATVEAAMEGLILLSKSAEKVSVGNDSLKSLLAMAGMVAVLSGLTYALGTLPIENVITGGVIVIAMGAIIAGLSGLMVLLSKTKVDAKTIAELALMTGIVTALAGLIIYFSTMLTDDQVNNAAIIADSVTKLMLTLSVTMIIMAYTCKVANGISPAAIVGIAVVILAVIVVVAAAMLLGTILGGMDDEYKNFIIAGINNLNDILAAVVEGITKISMALVEGVIEGIISSITTFIDGLQGIAESFVAVMNTFATTNSAGIDMALQMAEVILVLTAASLLDGLASFLGIGVDYDKLKEDMVAYANVLVAFNKTVGEVDNWDPIKETIGPAKALAEIANSLPKSGGIFDAIFGSSDMDEFGKSLESFANGLKSYYNSVKDITDWSPVDNSIPPAKALMELSENVPRTDGIAQKILGEQDMGDFGKKLKSFGESLISYYNTVKAVTDWKPVYDSVSPAGSLMELADKVPRTDGFAQKLLGEQDIESFGNKLVSFGKSLINFNNTVTGQNWAPIAPAALATDTFITLANKLPSSNGAFSFFTGGTIDFEDFGEEIVEYAKGLVDFANALSGITDWSSIANAIQPTQDLITMSNDLVNLSDGDIDDACDALLTIFETSAKILMAGQELAGAIGKNNISTMNELFGIISNFVYNVSGIPSFNSDDIITFLRRFSVEVLPYANDVAEDVKISNIRMFGTSIAMLAEEVSAFGKLYEVLGNENVNKVSGTLKILVEAFRGMNDINIDSVKNFISALKEVGSKAVGELVKALVNDAGLLELSNSIDKLFETAAGTQEQKQSLLDSYGELGKSAGEMFAAGLEGKDVTESITKLLPQGTKVVTDEAAKTAEEATEKTQKTVKEASKESTTKGMADAATEIIPNVVNTVKNGVEKAVTSGVGKALTSTIKDKLGVDISSYKSFGLGGSSADIARANAMANAAGVDIGSMFELPEELNGLTGENLFGDYDLDLFSDPYGFGTQEEVDESIKDYTEGFNNSLGSGLDDITDKTEKKAKKTKEKLKKINEKYFIDPSKDTVKGMLKTYNTNASKIIGPALTKMGKKYSDSALKSAETINKASNRFAEGLYFESEAYKEDVKAVTEAQEKIVKLQKAYKKAKTNKKKNEIGEQLKDAYKDYEKISSDVIEHINDGVTELKESVYENIKSFTNPFATAITDTVGDVFTKAEKGTRTSFYRLFRNIGSQIDATEQYKNLISQLRTAGYSEDVIKEVKEKGIAEGSQIAKALLQAGKEEVKAYNEKYSTVKKMNKKEWLSNIKQKSKDVKHYRKLMIEASNKGFSEDVLMEVGAMGIEEGTEYLEMLVSMTKKERDTTNKYYKRSKEASKSEANAIIGAYTYANDEGLKSLGELTSKKATSIGKNVCNGLVDGIQKNTGKVTKQAKTLGEAIYKTLGDTLKIHSPSKVTEDMGEYIDEGLEIGIDENGNSPVKAITTMADKITEVMENMVENINSILDGGIEAKPVIKPTLDDNEIKDKQIVTNYSAKLSKEINDSISNYEKSTKNKSKDKNKNSNAVFNFTQNNYSPEPLDRAGIYKDTKQLIRKQQATVTT